MFMVTIRITPLRKCNYMYPNSDNIIWFAQKYLPGINIKNIIQVIHFFPGDNIVIGYITFEYVRFPSALTGISINPIKFEFTKDKWELSMYTSTIDPRLGSSASIKTYFIHSDQSFEEVLEETDKRVEKYLEHAKDEFRDALTNKVVALFSLN